VQTPCASGKDLEPRCVLTLTQRQQNSPRTLDQCLANWWGGASSNIPTVQHSHCYSPSLLDGNMCTVAAKAPRPVHVEGIHTAPDKMVVAWVSLTERLFSRARIVRSVGILLYPRCLSLFRLGPLRNSNTSFTVSCYISRENASILH
jgi:hypothetical protein